MEFCADSRYVRIRMRTPNEQYSRYPFGIILNFPYCFIESADTQCFWGLLISTPSLLIDPAAQPFKKLTDQTLGQLFSTGALLITILF